MKGKLIASLLSVLLSEKNVDVLLEGENKKGYITGFSSNYLKVRTPWDPALINEIKKVKLKKIDKEGYLRF